jgi:hypothetical protein
VSFNYHARKVRDFRLDISIRRGALKSCILRLGWLTRQKYSAIWDRFAPPFGLDKTDRPSAEQLLDALTALERERNRVLERLRAFDRRRTREKLRGRRQLTTAEQEALRQALALPAPARRTGEELPAAAEE